MVHPLKGNYLVDIGIVLTLIPFASWCYILKKQHEISNSKTYRINVLIARTSLFMPLYALFMWIALIEPNTFEALQIPFAIVEGYSFISMFALIVTNLGGWFHFH